METRKIDAEFYCGVDLHARTSYLCVLDRSGGIQLRRNIPNDFQIFKEFMRPFVGGLVVGCESTYNYYWLLDGCREAGIPFYLGHALYMKAISGHKKKNDPLDAETIANLMRSNYFPEAYPYPREMRATRDLLRRRHRLARIRAGAYAHIQLVFQQYGIRDVGPTHVKNKSTRRGLMERFSEPNIRFSIKTDLDVIDALTPLISELEKVIEGQSIHHRGREYRLLLTVPGVGSMITLVILYETHDIGRFRSVQDYSSYSRVVKCARQSAGKFKGYGNPKIGNPYLKWAFSQIIISAQQSSEGIRKYYQRLEGKYGRARARAQMAHKFCVAIYYMLKRGEAFDEARFLGKNK
ncbi:IS110 family transposase [candidate division KSB1 bacterium]|nr:IS110 family transposase [candidate division KSB1 bacterium]